MLFPEGVLAAGDDIRGTGLVHTHCEAGFDGAFASLSDEPGDFAQQFVPEEDPVGTFPDG